MLSVNGNGVFMKDRRVYLNYLKVNFYYWVAKKRIRVICFVKNQWEKFIRLFKKRYGLVKCGVTVREVDCSILPEFKQCIHIGLFGNSTNRQIIIGPSIKHIEWYQFWRWSLIGEYLRQCDEANKQFNNLFGIKK